MRKGMDGGFSLRFPKGINLRGTAGIRYGDEDNQNVKFSSLFVNFHRIFRPGYNLSGRISKSQTQFTTSYRPMATFRMPIGRTRAHLSVGGNLYRTAGVDNNSYYFELGGTRSFRLRYFLSGSWRQYMGGPLQSLQVMTEAGVNF